jgi:hypothetical protein
VGHQLAVTVLAEVRPDRVEGARSLLEAMGRSANERFGFEKLPVLHFARLLFLEASNDLRGRPIQAQIAFMADIDGPLDSFISDLVESGAEALDEVFENCVAYPSSAVRTRDRQIEYLRSHTVGAAATYVNTVGLTLDQIHREAELYSAIENFLDRPEHDWSRLSPLEVRRRIRDFVEGQESLRWALAPPARPSFAWRMGEAVHFVAVPLLLIALLPVILLALPFYLVALRVHESRDRPSTEKPDARRLLELAELEDLEAVQNPFAAVGFVKLGSFRRWTLRFVLWLANHATRHVFNRGDLAGVKTIHFARWVFMDGGRRMVFASNYDGSLESYMDDFIDKEAWALNAVFSNGFGYPKTSWLVRGGARDELAFKNYLRVHQVPVHVWYSAAPSLTTLNINKNALIRKGLSGSMDEREARRWLQLL